MKRILLFAVLATAAILSSCTPKAADPVEQAIVSEILSMPQGFSKVTFLNCEMIDSTTFAQELDRRVKLFETKRDADGKLLLKYTQEGKPRNAALKNESYRRDLEILRSLDSLRAASAGILDEIAYYDYRFSADADGEESGKMQFRDAYAAVTPDFEVIGLTAQKKDLHKGLGKVIPGYLELLRGESEEE